VGELVSKECYFLNEAGFGLEASIAEKNLITKKRDIHLPVHIDYILKVIKELTKNKTRNLIIETEHGEYKTDNFLNLSIVNTTFFNVDNFVKLDPDAQDGLFEIIIIKPEHMRGFVESLLHDVSFRRHPEIDIIKARKIKIKTTNLPLQIEGEMFGKTPATIRMAKRKQKILVPKKSSSKQQWIKQFSSNLYLEKIFQQYLPFDLRSVLRQK